jgi:hypothetical protein
MAKHHKSSMHGTRGKAHQTAAQHADVSPDDLKHVALSTPTQVNDHPARNLPNPQGGSFWGSSPHGPPSPMGPEDTSGQPT